jgi:diacylglycerol kinase family enzyme
VAKRRTTLLVANPTARTGRAKRSISHAMTALGDARLEPEFCPTLPAGKTVAKIASRLEQEDIARVVYMGGDGTFADAAKGIILAREKSGLDVPLGMLPMGTANDQGRSFGIMAGDKSLESNIGIISEGVEQWLDVGQVEALDDQGELLARDLWFDSFGTGLSAQILACRNRDREVANRIPLIRQVYRDKIVYTGATFRSLARALVGSSHFAVDLTIDGHNEQYSKVTNLLVQKTILYAGDWIFDHRAKPDDGRFEIVVARGHGDWARAALGGHKHNPVTDDDLKVLGLEPRTCPTGKCIEIRIVRPKGMTPLSSQIDGEEFPSSDHFRIENLFHHLRIIVPENPHWI